MIKTTTARVLDYGEKMKNTVLQTTFRNHMVLGFRSGSRSLGNFHTPHAMNRKCPGAYCFFLEAHDSFVDLDTDRGAKSNADSRGSGSEQ